MKVVVAGVSGSGKTTVGRALADRLDVPFVDGDDLHPEANVASMAEGVALDDAARQPWLRSVGAWLADHTDGVVACSALKRSYRDVLREHAPDARVLLLDGDRAVIAERQADRPGHFMPTSLQDSQWAAFEPLGADEAGATVDVALAPDEVVDAFVRQCG
ncbi:MAG: gluconate kinase [Nocardioides sp.]|nr:gluconate kinase [Nocardioides sp.]